MYILGQKRPLSLLSNLVNHQNTPLNAETTNLASIRHILGFGSSLQSHLLCLTLYMKIVNKLRTVVFEV